MTDPRNILETGERKVYKDSDNKRRVEMWTNGEWIKVGRDIEDIDLCLTFKAKDDYYDDFRRNEHPVAFKIENELGFRDRYVVDRKGPGNFRFYKEDNLVLHVADHELGAIRHAYNFARQHRHQEYDWEDIAREYAHELMPSEDRFEFREFDISSDTKSTFIELIEKDPAVRKVDDKLIRNIKEDEHTVWNGAHYDDTNEENPFYYKFTVKTPQIKDEVNGDE